MANDRVDRGGVGVVSGGVNRHSDLFVFVLGWIDCMDHDSKKVLLGEKGVI